MNIEVGACVRFVRDVYDWDIRVDDIFEIVKIDHDDVVLNVRGRDGWLSGSVIATDDSQVQEKTYAVLTLQAAPSVDIGELL